MTPVIEQQRVVAQQARLGRRARASCRRAPTSAVPDTMPPTTTRSNTFDDHAPSASVGPHDRAVVELVEVPLVREEVVQAAEALAPAARSCPGARTYMQPGEADAGQRR